MAVANLAGREPAFQAYSLLRAGYVIAPILAGADKFFDFMVRWDTYLAPWIDRIMPGTARQFMMAVGVIEIIAGLVVLFAPRLGSLVVAAWLGAIVINLVTFDPPRYYDIALRDFGLMLGAITLNRLATQYQGRAAIVTHVPERLRRAS